MPDRTPSSPFEPSPSLARISITPSGWCIDTRGPRAARSYSFARKGEAAEFARVLRDDGGWALRFGPGAEGVERLVAEIDEAFAA